jgi:hypothetical protein
MPTRALPAVALIAALSSTIARKDAANRGLSCRGRCGIFEAPHNLRVVEFAKMAGKSRRWISTR